MVYFGCYRLYRRNRDRNTDHETLTALRGTGETQMDLSKVMEYAESLASKEKLGCAVISYDESGHLHIEIEDERSN